MRRPPIDTCPSGRVLTNPPRQRRRRHHSGASLPRQRGYPSLPAPASRDERDGEVPAPRVGHAHQQLACGWGGTPGGSQQTGGILSPGWRLTAKVLSGACSRQAVCPPPACSRLPAAHGTRAPTDPARAPDTLQMKGRTAASTPIWPPVRPSDCHRMARYGRMKTAGGGGEGSRRGGRRFLARPGRRTQVPLLPHHAVAATLTYGAIVTAISVGKQKQDRSESESERAGERRALGGGKRRRRSGGGSTDPPSPSRRRPSAPWAHRKKYASAEWRLRGARRADFILASR